MGAGLTWASLSTPIGELTMVASQVGLLRLAFSGAEPVLAEFPDDDLRADDGIAAHAAEQITEYFGHARQRFDIPLDWSLSQGLQQYVLRTLYEQVPFGETLSYQDLAVLAGRPHAARVVGSIMGSNPIPLVVPCHRVVASGGGLGGFGSGPEVKRRLLVIEGALEPTLLELDLLSSG